MKSLERLAACLAGAFALTSGLRAQNATLPASPYTVVGARNVFSLVSPPPTQAEPASTPAAPPVKITLTGITDILGQWQVLFKVAEPPGKEDSYILTEGQSQDDIAVVKIDEKTGSVTFNNHGLVQEIPLANAAAFSTAAAGNPARSPFAQNRIRAGWRFGNRSGNPALAVANTPNLPDTSTYLPAVPRRALPVN
jgi:hypothetical protein